MLGKMMDKPLLVSDLIKHAARYHGDTKVISKEVDGTTTEKDWASINTGAKRLAKALGELNLEQGDRIATIAWSNYRHLEIWYAVSGSGLVCHTINPRLFPEQLIFIINEAQDKVIFFDKTFVRLVAGIKPHLKSVKHFICMSGKDDEISAALPEALFYDELVDKQKDDYVWPEFDEKMPSALCYTSGTTGNPKGALYTNRTTVIHTFAITLPDALGLSASDVVMPVAPMFHANAWGIPYATALVGAALVLPGPNLDGDSLVDLIDDYQITVTLGVPTIWKALIAAARDRGSKLESMTRSGIGGTPCPAGMVKVFKEEFDCDTIHAWGMTEMSPLGTMNRPKAKHKDLSDEAMYKLRLGQGRPSFGVEIRVVDKEDNNRVLPNDGKTQGNLQTRGYWILDTYFGKEESALEPDGWFDTGDIATIDEDGYVIIRDRAKDLIKSGGEWICSVELEQIGYEHPDIELVAAIGAIHPKWDERPVMVVQCKPETQPSIDDILGHYQDKIAKWQIPNTVVFVDDMPISGTGKIDKKKLRETYANILVDEGLV